MGASFQEIEINAPVDTVWQTIRNFQNASWAPNVVSLVLVIGSLAFGSALAGSGGIADDNVIDSGEFHGNFKRRSNRHAFRYR